MDTLVMCESVTSVETEKEPLGETLGNAMDGAGEPDMVGVGKGELLLPPPLPGDTDPVKVGAKREGL